MLGAFRVHHEVCPKSSGNRSPSREPPVSYWKHLNPRIKCTRGVVRVVACYAAIGVDLGTTNSLVGIVKNGQPKLVADDHGNVLLPSVVRYTDNGVIVGEQVGLDAQNTCYYVKRMIGRQLSDVQELADRVAYTVSADDSGRAVVESPVAGTVCPEDVSAEILKVLKARAEGELGEAADRVVVTVPAHFDKRQRLATMNAALSAGFERISLLQEPIAAAMAYGYGRHQEQQAAVLVFDLGGGTFDVSLLQSFEGIMEVVASDGNNELGGCDMDVLLSHAILEKAGLSADESDKLWNTGIYRERVLQAAERCKIALSSATSSAVAIMLAADNGSATSHLSVDVSRGDLHTAVQPFLSQLWAPLKRLGEDYKLQFAWYPDGSGGGHASSIQDRFAPPPRRVSQLVLVGGATKAPVITAFAERAAGVQRCTGVDPEHCVALGAAVQAGLMEGNVRGGLEMTDSIYVQELQGRVSGFQM